MIDSYLSSDVSEIWILLLFGSEGYGLKYQTLKNSDFLLRININEKIESLNISNSAAVVFHFINNLKKDK